MRRPYYLIRRGEYWCYRGVRSFAPCRYKTIPEQRNRPKIFIFWRSDSAFQVTPFEIRYFLHQLINNMVGYGIIKS